MTNDQEHNTPEGIPSIEDHPDFKATSGQEFPTPGADVPQDEESTALVETKVDEMEPAFGVHIIMMPDGAFAIQATGEPNLGEMQMLLARALKSIEARMVAETVVQLMKQEKGKRRIITPGTPGM